MTTFKVDVSNRARRRIAQIDDWWRENRRAAPDLFNDELAASFRQLETAPGSGRRYPRTKRKNVRYLVLQRSRECVIYEVHPRKHVVSIVTVASPTRGPLPAI